MLSFEKLLTQIAKSLKAEEIPYMIIGGQAVLMYGEPRLTRDVDITLGIDTDDFDRVMRVVKRLSLQPLSDNVREFVNKNMVLPVIDKASGIRVDFIFSFTPYEIQAIKRARDILINDKKVCFASCEDVIIHKIFAGRPRDIEDVENIMLKNRKLNIRYILHWLKEFDAACGPAQKFTKTFNDIRKKIDKHFYS